MKIRMFLAACSVALAHALPASADILSFDTILGPEILGATGSGTVVVAFDTTTNALAIDAIWSGLSGSTTVSHIHCCVATPGTAGIAVAQGTLPGFPAGVTAGSYSTVLDLASTSSFAANFLTANGGTAASATTVLLAGLGAGTAYFNIHTSLFPGGEIRGFLQTCGGTTGNPCETISRVPEPATLALLSLGLAGLGFSRRKH